MLYLIIALSAIYLTYPYLAARRTRIDNPDNESCEGRDHIWTKWKDDFTQSSFQHRECKRCGVKIERLK